jgi:small subunit ribosomal protein S16
MAVKIRLQRKGRKQRPFYHIVVADSRSPRDGKFIEKLGTYNPMTVPATIDIDRERAYEWITYGAQPTDTVRAILRFKGVLLKKHLQRGVAKGAITQEQADARWKEWIDAKESKIAGRVAKTAEDKIARMAAISGTPPPPPKPVVVEEAAPAVEETVEAAVEAATESAEEAVAEATPESAEEAVAEATPEAPEATTEAPAEEAGENE